MPDRMRRGASSSGGHSVLWGERPATHRGQILPPVAAIGNEPSTVGYPNQRRRKRRDDQDLCAQPFPQFAQSDDGPLVPNSLTPAVRVTGGWQKSLLKGRLQGHRRSPEDHRCPLPLTGDEREVAMVRQSERIQEAGRLPCRAYRRVLRAEVARVHQPEFTLHLPDN